ncbi:hypothetical protein COJ96_02145 [Bacillus sp. AFS073361]|uniref:flagellar brake protein n=1 Tax=Bacillus sp. AFS073361 TaxID=2033511 RepID=UPI000BF9E55E|nr:flagellar brake domain-containing protein [Bacillus sp. AFS073361]PFP30786.1 hypothetical protein COJ96_02145 [Bacillus sp. AFS073361]
MYPTVNQNIVIDIKSESRTCRSIVAEIGEKEILIGFPIDGNKIGMLPEGTKIEVTFIAKENQFKFQSEIKGRKKDIIPLYRISKPHEKEIIKIQRRNNFRVNSNLRLTINEVELNTINISAGGVLFSCRSDFLIQEGEFVKGILHVPSAAKKEVDFIPFKGQIKRIKTVEDQERKNIGMEFVEVEERDQMKIIQYCFQKQRQMR